MEELFDWLHFWVSVEVVLSELPRDAWHVRRFPCEDVSILMDELYECAFLFVRETCPDGKLLRRISGDEVDFLGVLCWLKFWVGVRSRLLK